MLAKIKSLFFTPPVTETEPPEATDSLENPNFITDPQQIAKLLADIEANTPLCAVIIPGVAKEFSSSLLGLNENKQFVLLDELIPKDGNELLSKIKTVKVQVFHKGIHAAFNVTGIEIGSAGGISYYKGNLPERIYYPQRRHSHRIEVSTLDIPFSGITQHTRLSVSGYLYDLSRSGACMQLPVSVGRTRIQRGDTIQNCQISFDDYLMDFDFNIRFIKPGPPGINKLQLGGMFENLSGRSETKLSYFITALERQEIRKQKT